MKPTQLVTDFIRQFIERWFLVNPEDHERVISMLNKIESVVLHKDVAGGFISAICREDYRDAQFRADIPNFRYTGIYICFRTWLKNEHEKKS
jgi:hypothetical protein